MKEEILNKLFEYVSSLEVIAREQIPDIVNQVLTKGIILNSVGIFFSILSFINLFISILVYKKYRDDYSDIGDIRNAYLVISAIFCFLGIIGIICCGIDLLTIIYAPKAYLLGVLK